MLRLETKSLGTVKMSFRHRLPHVEVINQNNRLASAQIKEVHGSTSCRLQLRTQDEGEYFEGIAYTHPQDPYTKSVGRNLSFVRAMDQVPNLTSEHLLELLDAYVQVVKP